MGTDKPLISVVVPVYKTEAYLRQCVDSLLIQTYSHLEIILVDDGSPDGSGAVCDQYARRDARICVIHQKNGGVSAARNAGVQVATGQYIAFVDSDDWVEPDYVKNTIPSSRAVCSRCGCRNQRFTNRYLDGRGSSMANVLPKTV